MKPDFNPCVFDDSFHVSYTLELFTLSQRSQERRQGYTKGNVLEEFGPAASGTRGHMQGNMNRHILEEFGSEATRA